MLITLITGWSQIQYQINSLVLLITLGFIMLIGFSAVPAAFGHVNLVVSVFLLCSYSFALISYVVFVVLSKINFKFDLDQDSLRDQILPWTHFKPLRIMMLIIMIYDIMGILV